MTTTQQEFLRDAMVKLDMTRDTFSARIGCARRTLDKWLLPPNSKDHRPMGETIWVLVREILEHEALKKELNKSKKSK